MAVLKVAEVDNAALQCTTLCVYWQLLTLHFCKLMIVFKIGNVKELKIL